MKIQYLNGGLANQTFQYIFARFHDLENPTDVPMFLDDSSFFINPVHNGYELETVFQIHPNLLSRFFEADVWDYMVECKRNGSSVPQVMADNGIPLKMITDNPQWEQHNPFQGTVNILPTNQYFPEIVQFSDDIYYNGYWLNQNWFQKYQDIFLKELAFPKITEKSNLDYLKDIQSSESLSVHIRRGDYAALGLSWKEEHYLHVLTSLHTIRPDFTVFVFSDDIPWCKDHSHALGLSLFSNVIFVEGNDVERRNYRDLQLMTQCKYMIDSPSSFCFLGLMLNPTCHIYNLVMNNAQPIVMQAR